MNPPPIVGVMGSKSVSPMSMTAPLLRKMIAMRLLESGSAILGLKSGRKEQRAGAAQEENSYCSRRDKRNCGAKPSILIVKLPFVSS